MIVSLRDYDSTLIYKIKDILIFQEKLKSTKLHFSATDAKKSLFNSRVLTEYILVR